MTSRRAARVSPETAPPKPRKRDRGRNEANIAATQYWHQGFGRIRVSDHEVVPFLTRESAVRVADRAASNTRREMKVIPVQDFWGYREDMT